MTLKSYERRNYVLYDGEEKERRMRKKGKRMAKRTNRPFPPEGAKEPFKIFNGVFFLGGRASNEEEILKKNLLRVSQLGGRKTRSHSREGQFKSSLSPGFLFFPANEPGTMRCRSNSGTVQLLPDQTSRSRGASLVASLIRPVMRGCAIAEDARIVD